MPHPPILDNNSQHDTTFWNICNFIRCSDTDFILGSFERCSYKIFNWQVGDSRRILYILHVLNVQCAWLQLCIYSHYGIINKQRHAAAPAAWVQDDGCSMPPLPRHEYRTMGAVCRRSRGMSTGRWVQHAAAPAAWVAQRLSLGNCDKHIMLMLDYNIIEWKLGGSTGQ